MLDYKNSAIVVVLVSVTLLTVIMVSGCWSPFNDYWTDIDTETETNTDLTDGGECFEDDTDECIDSGL